MNLMSNLTYTIDNDEIYLVGVFDKQVKRIKSEHKPYMFVRKKDLEQIEYVPELHDVEYGYYDEYGDEVVKLMFYIPSDVSKARKLFMENDMPTYEADVPYADRVIADQVVKIKYSDDNIAFVDIEVWDANGMPENGEQKVMAITVYDINGNAKYFSIYDYPNEKSMLMAFQSYLKRNGYTIFAAWNVSFDYDYLMARFKRLGVSSFYLSLMHPVDMLALFKAVHKGLPSYKLDYVAHHLDIAPKIKRTKLIAEMTKEELKEYNNRDAFIIWQIELQTFVVRRVISQANTFQVRVDMLNATKLWDILHMREARKYNMVLKTKVGYGEHTKYEGAIVVQPRVGVHEDVADIDVDSLYPHVIMVENIDIGNFGGKIMPSLMKQYFELRKAYKKKRDEYEPGTPEYVYYDLLQHSYKITINSGYGYFGTPHSRYYDRKKAEAVTRGGQAVLKRMISFVENELGLLVIYGDSVSGDTKIIVRENGRIRFMPIKDMFRKVSIVDERSGKEYYLHNEWETLTLDDEGRIVWRPIKYVMRHKTSKRMYRIWLNNTEYLDVTEDHGIFGYVNVLKRRRLNADEMGLVLISPKDLGKDVKSLIMPRYAIPINKRNDTSIKLWELIGLLVGDGSWGGSSRGADYYVYLATGLDTNELVDKILEPLKHTGVIHNYYVKNKKGDICILSKSLVRIMKHFKDESGNKIIPEWVNNLPHDFMSAFLRGYFTADGTVILRKSHPIIRLTSVDYELLSRVKELLLLLGVPSVIFAETNTNKYLGKDTGSYSKHLYVKDVLGFSMSVGFILDRKNDRIKNVEFPMKYTNIRDYNFTLQRVYKVEEIEYDDYVYDIEVEDTHRFFANGILVHNTDSLFVKLEHPEQGKYVADLINVYIAPYHVKLEAVFKKLIIVKSASGERASKKRYIGLTYDNKWVIKGIELVRGDVPELTKIVMRQVIEKIFNGASKSEVYAFLTDVEKRMRKGEFDEQLILSVGVKDNLDDYKNTPPHVRAYEIAIAKGYKPVDNTIQFVFANGDVVPILPTTDLSDLVINYNYYWTRYIMRPISRILSAVYAKQSTLDKFVQL